MFLRSKNSTAHGCASCTNPLFLLQFVVVLYRYTNGNGKLEKKASIYTKDEHKIDVRLVDPDALRIVRMLQSSGFSAYIVGGAVRDLLIGNIPKDFDITTNATPARIHGIFRNSRIIGKRFRLVHIVVGAKIFEVSTFRSLKTGTVGNVFGTMDDDAFRRDFSCNALYYDPVKEYIVDYVHGFDDIQKRRIVPVIPLNIIFEEDPVRMIRCVKYACTTGFSLSFSLKQKIKKDAHLLEDVSSSRMTEEFLKIVASGKSAAIAELALRLGIFKYVQPKAASLMKSNGKFEKKYIHSLQELDALCAKSSIEGLGDKMSFFLYDYVSELPEIKDASVDIASDAASDIADAAEIYSIAWKSCRNFILPINPPRIEIDNAVNYILGRMGLSKTKRRQKRFRQRKYKNG